jgi:putative spermidine/putrescine transport system substrate-binding protein
MWNDSWSARGAQDDMWLPMDRKHIPHLADVAGELQQPDDLGATFAVTPFGIAYNPKYVDPPTSWTDLYNPKYRGKVALWDIFFDWLIMAARIEGGDEKNLEPGVAAWKAAKANIGFWANSLPVLHEALHRGEVWLAADWASWTLSAKREGKSVEFAFPEEGATHASLTAQVHAGVSDDTADLTQKLFNEYLTPDFQLEQARKSFYSPTVKGVEIPADIDGPGLVTAEEAATKLVRYDYGYVGAHFSEINETITRELK